MINYRYRILSKLGEGGTGEVCLVEDTLRDRQEAMKVFSSSTAQTIDVDEVRKEFSILMNLSHPNLVHVFDFGTVLHCDRRDLVGRHFYTMEYLQGNDSLSYFSTKPLGKDKLKLLKKAFLQTLSVLEYIHQQGIIHFDIKPQNLFVSEGGQQEDITVKLTDFGFSAAKLEAVEFPVRGTLDYTAPEMIQGLPVDTRLDLYSLGITMYHLLEGHCPFESSNPVELVKRVLSEEVPPLRRIKDADSVFLDVIERLCRKTPDDRFPSALQVLLMFRPPEHAEVIRKCLTFLRKPRFVGRAKEKKVFEEVFDSLVRREASPKVIAVVGTEGMGKSELLREMAKSARSKGILVMETERAIPQYPFASLSLVLRQLGMELHSSEGTASSPASKYLSLLPQLDRAVGIASGGHTADWNGELERTAQLYSQFLLAASKVVPFVLMVNELAQVDMSSMATLRALAENLSDGRVAVLVGVTSDPSTELPFEERRTLRLVLEELSQEDVTELVRSALGDCISASEIPQKLYQLYGGIPTLLMEALRAMAEVLPLSELDDGAVVSKIVSEVEAMLPKSLEDFFSRRFSKLTREEFMLLQVLACFEHPPSIALLGNIVPMHPQRLREYLETLQHEGHVLLLENGTRCRIRHTKLRSYLYGTIGEARTKLHTFIASVFSAMSDVMPWSDIGELARQYALGNMPEKASTHYETAGEHAVQHQALPRAVDLFQKALELAEGNSSTDRHFSLSEKLAQAYFASGSHQRSIEVYKQLLARLPSNDARRSSIHQAVGKGLSRLGENAEALRHFEEALKITTNASERFELLQEIVALKIAGGHYDEAVELCRSQREFALSHPNKELLGAVETNLGRAEFFRGKLEDSKHSFTAALEIYKTLQNKRKTVDALINLGNVLSVTQDYRGALEHWGQALGLSKDLGTLHHEAQIQNNMGIAHYKLHEFKEARSCYERAKEIFQDLNSKSGLALALTNLGEVAYAECEYELALEWWSEALGLYQEMKDLGGMAETLLQLTQVQNIFGDLEQMQHQLKQAEDLICEYNLQTFRGQLSYMKGLLSLALRKYEDAHAAFFAARDTFQQESDHEKFYSALLRIVEIQIALGHSEEGARMLQGALEDEKLKLFPLIKAELYYILGRVAQKKLSGGGERPLVYFKLGMDLIQNEMLAEISWKLSYALAKEYALRKQRDKAERNYSNTKLIIEHFASRITFPELRQRYLCVDDKAKVLTEISSYLQ